VLCCSFCDVSNHRHKIRVGRITTSHQYAMPSGRFAKQEKWTLESPAEIGVLVQAPGTLMLGFGGITPGNFLRLQNPAIWCILAGKWFAMSSDFAFLNTLSKGTHMFLCVPAACQRCVPTRSPRNELWLHLFVCVRLLTGLQR